MIDLAKRAESHTISQYAHHVFLTMLGICGFCWLTIATLSERQLLTNDGTVELPVVGVSVPTLAFFFVSPLMLIGVFTYFHIYMQRQWEALARLPAVFPDGEPLDRKTDAWMMLGLVRAQFPRLAERLPMFRTQLLLNLVLGWWLVPATMLGLWVRYSHRHDLDRSILHVLAFAWTMHFAWGSYAVATGTLRGRKRTVMLWSRHLAAIAVVFALDAVMQYQFEGRGKSLLFNVCIVDQNISERPAQWHRIERRLKDEYEESLKIATDLNSSADEKLADAQSLLKTIRSEYGQTRGAGLKEINLAGSWISSTNLSEADLSWARFTHAILFNVDLGGATLERASLDQAHLGWLWAPNANFVQTVFTKSLLCEGMFLGADLRSAVLDSIKSTGSVDFRLATMSEVNLKSAQLPKALFIGSTLVKAELTLANLEGADFSHADLREADLRGANLKDANFESADLTGVKLGAFVDRDALNQPEAITNLDGANLADCKGLTIEQLALAKIGDTTKLPKYLAQAQSFESAPQVSPRVSQRPIEQRKQEEAALSWPSSQWLPSEAVSPAGARPVSSLKK